QLLLSLWDRGLISDESIQDRFGEMPDIEETRIRRDERKRANGQKPPKASPYHDPQQTYGLQKIFAQTGVVTPSEVGVTLEENAEGEKSLVDINVDSQQKQAKLAQKSQQDNLDHQYRTDKLQMKHGVHPLQQAANGPPNTPGVVNK